MDQFILNVQQKSLEFDGNKVKEALNSEPGILGSLPSAVISYYKGKTSFSLLFIFIRAEDIINKII